MSRPTRRPRLLFAGVFLLGALLAGSGVVVAATVVKSGKAVTAVKVVTETSSAELVHGTGWTDIPGMSTSISVPSSQKALLLITFSAESYCYDAAGYSPTTHCMVRAIVDGMEALPGPVIFDGAADGNGSLAAETNSMQFVAGPLNAGSHTVEVQWYLDESSSSFVMEQRTLSVLRSRL